MSTLEELSAAVERGRRKKAVPLVEQALAEGIDAQVILDEGLISAMDRIGEKFSRNEVFVPEVLMSAKTMSMCTDVLKPHLAQEGAEPVGRGLIATVQGDMHDIGKNLVRLMLEGKGFAMDDLGVDVSPDAIVAHIQEHPEVKIVCLSTLLTTTLPALGQTVSAVREAGLADGRAIFVGGAPVTQQVADEVGADYYTDDAGSCAAKAAEVIATL